MKIVTGHQPNYLPYPGFFDKIIEADLFVLVDNTQFVKRGPFGWIHRNRIRTPDGWMWLTVPCITSGRFHQNIHEVEIANHEPWRRKHKKSIHWHYKKAPYFDKYWTAIQQIYEQEWEKLQPLSEAFLELFFEWLNIDTPVERATSLQVEGKSTEYVIDLCQKTNADQYLSGIHGRDYLEMEQFDDVGVELLFQDFSFPVYNQVYNDTFIPNLSILDLLMNHGPESREILLGQKTVRNRNNVTIAEAP